jgi:hypothetical protein
MFSFLGVAMHKASTCQARVKPKALRSVRPDPHCASRFGADLSGARSRRLFWNSQPGSLKVSAATCLVRGGIAKQPESAAMLRIDHGVLDPFSELSSIFLGAKLLRRDLSNSFFQKKIITTSMQIYISETDVLPCHQRGFASSTSQAQAKPPRISVVIPDPLAE